MEVRGIWCIGGGEQIALRYAQAVAREVKCRKRRWEVDPWLPKALTSRRPTTTTSATPKAVALRASVPTLCRLATLCTTTTLSTAAVAPLAAAAAAMAAVFLVLFSLGKMERTGGRVVASDASRRAVMLFAGFEIDFVAMVMYGG